MLNISTVSYNIENSLIEHSNCITTSLTALVTSCGFCVRIVIIVWNTSTICSALNLLILTTRAQNVPERPTPSLQEHSKNLISVYIYIYIFF